MSFEKWASMGLTNGHAEIIMVKSQGFALLLLGESIGGGYLIKIKEERKQQLWTVAQIITRKQKSGENAYLHCILRETKNDRPVFLFPGCSAGFTALRHTLIIRKGKGKQT